MNRLLGTSHLGLVICFMASWGCCTDRVYRCHEGDIWRLSGRHGDAGSCGGTCSSGACETGDCASGSCATGDCGPCAGGCGSPRLLDWQHWREKLTCGRGCGDDIFWGEWYGDPPDDCDPCNACGQFTGDRPCCMKRHERVQSFLGSLSQQRYRGQTCTGESCQGCTTCAP